MGAAGGVAGPAGWGSGGGGVGTGIGAGTTAGASDVTAGGVAQPASTINPAANQQWSVRMEWILLEAAVALGLGIFIAWWLMRGKGNSPRDGERDD